MPPGRLRKFSLLILSARFDDVDAGTARELGAFPSPLWGGVRVYVGARVSYKNNDPPPQPSPTRGEGANRVRCECLCTNLTEICSISRFGEFGCAAPPACACRRRRAC